MEPSPQRLCGAEINSHLSPFVHNDRFTLNGYSNSHSCVRTGFTARQSDPRPAHQNVHRYAGDNIESNATLSRGDVVALIARRAIRSPTAAFSTWGNNVKNRAHLEKTNSLRTKRFPAVPKQSMQSRHRPLPPRWDTLNQSILQNSRRNIQKDPERKISHRVERKSAEQAQAEELYRERKLREGFEARAASIREARAVIKHMQDILPRAGRFAPLSKEEDVLVILTEDNHLKKQDLPPLSARPGKTKTSNERQKKRKKRERNTMPCVHGKTMDSAIVTNSVDENDSAESSNAMDDSSDESSFTSDQMSGENETLSIPDPSLLYELKLQNPTAYARHKPVIPLFVSEGDTSARRTSGSDCETDSLGGSNKKVQEERPQNASSFNGCAEQRADVAQEDMLLKAVDKEFEKAMQINIENNLESGLVEYNKHREKLILEISAKEQWVRRQSELEAEVQKLAKFQAFTSGTHLPIIYKNHDELKLVRNHSIDATGDNKVYYVPSDKNCRFADEDTSEDEEDEMYDKTGSHRQDGHKPSNTFQPQPEEFSFGVMSVHLQRFIADARVMTTRSDNMLRWLSEMRVLDRQHSNVGFNRQHSFASRSLSPSDADDDAVKESSSALHDFSFMSNLGTTRGTVDDTGLRSSRAAFDMMEKSGNFDSSVTDQQYDEAIVTHEKVKKCLRRISQRAELSGRWYEPIARAHLEKFIRDTRMIEAGTRREVGALKETLRQGQEECAACEEQISQRQTEMEYLQKQTSRLSKLLKFHEEHRDESKRSQKRNMHITPSPPAVKLGEFSDDQSRQSDKDDDTNNNHKITPGDEEDNKDPRPILNRILMSPTLQAIDSNGDFKRNESAATVTELLLEGDQHMGRPVDASSVSSTPLQENEKFDGRLLLELLNILKSTVTVVSDKNFYMKQSTSGKEHSIASAGSKTEIGTPVKKQSNTRLSDTAMASLERIIKSLNEMTIFRK